MRMVAGESQRHELSRSFVERSTGNSSSSDFAHLHTMTTRCAWQNVNENDGAGLLHESVCRQSHPNHWRSGGQ
jgi:hypothetical protein